MNFRDINLSTKIYACEAGSDKHINAWPISISRYEIILKINGDYREYTIKEKDFVVLVGTGSRETRVLLIFMCYPDILEYNKLNGLEQKNLFWLLKITEKQ